LGENQINQHKEKHQMKMKMGFKAHLKRLRRARGLTLREVENLTGGEVSNCYLSQLEQGNKNNPSPHIVWKLAKVYQISYIELMYHAGYITSRDIEIAKVRFLC
jgi:transcriptional regulator with XRE-family HTH domain